MQDIINQCHPDADKTLAKLHTTCKILFWSQVQKLYVMITLQGNSISYYHIKQV
jgi:hypothetical protein